MTDFTASNGINLKTLDDGQIEIVYPGSGSRISWARTNEAQALREFFQHERDEELGRWRWPENQTVVVYEAWSTTEAGRRIVRVVNEETGSMTSIDEGGSGVSHLAADAYFEAHPKRKPWEDAKPGEVWEINGAHAWRLESGAFMFDDESFLFTEGITSGSRIWPEETA